MTEGGSGGGFSWGLTPSGRDAGTPEPAATAPVAVPPDADDTPLIVEQPAASPPAAPPPAAPPPAAPPPAAPPPLAAGVPDTPTPVESGGAVDALFGESQFHEYDEGLVTAQPARRPPPRGTRVAARTSGIPRTQRALIVVVGGLVAVLALVALFFLGTRLPILLAGATSSPTPTPSRTATPTPTPTATGTGPVAAGVHGWNELRGGECLDPFTSPWAETFTVVDCAAAHPAQLIARGTFASATAPTFPGAAALQSQLSLLCAAPGVLDLAAAAPYTDAQLQGSYPVTAEQWTAGQHDYFCFLSRSSGQPLTGSVAAAK